MDVPVHQPGELACDRKAEPGAAEAPRRRAIRLREGVEQARKRLLIHADAGIRHADADAMRRTLGRGRHAPAHIDAAGLRELHGIGDEVGDALVHAHTVETRASPARRLRAQRRA